MGASAKPAIVVCGGAAGLAVIRALASQNIPVVAIHTEKDEFAHFSNRAADRRLAPHPENAQAAFIDFLLDHSVTWRGGLLVPCSDAALSAISRNKSLLDSCYTVACPDWEVTKLFLEKKNTCELARIAGVPSPWTFYLRSEADFEKRSSIDFPCLVKPSSSHQYHERFRTKMRCVQNIDQARHAYREAASLGLEMMLQEFVPGGDANGANYNSYFWEGAPLVEFTAQKVRNAPPAFGSPRVVVSHHIPEVIELGRKLLRVAGYSGFSCTEFKKDPRDGVYKLMEVNVRHNLSARLAVRCGINFPYIQYQHLVAGRVPTAQTFETGVYWIELLRDIGQSILHFHKEKYSWKKYLEPYVRKHVFAVTDLRDPKPFLAQTIRTGRRTLRSFFSKKPVLAPKQRPVLRVVTGKKPVVVSATHKSAEGHEPADSV